MTDEKDLIRERKKKLENISEFSLAYPNKVIKSDTTRSLINTCSNEDKKSLEEKNILTNICGRVMTIREMGNSVFADLHDEYGKIQIYLNKKNLDEISQNMFKNLDLGDIVGISGVIFKTKTQELTINVDSFLILSKCLRPLPEKFHGIADIEIKYRQRYLDLMTNLETRIHFKKRSKIIKIIRNYFDERDYIEVETPMMHIIPGGANAKPFITHHNSLDMDLFLRIAPELFLKRCIIGGYEKVFEINRSFRNEGLSIKHNPEFTMIEFYSAYENYEYLMQTIEDLFKLLILNLDINKKSNYQDFEIDYSTPFKRITFHECIAENADNFDNTQINDLSYLKKYCLENNLKTLNGTSIEILQLEIFEKMIEKKLISPTFVTHYPTKVSPLARAMDDNPDLTERFELFVAGREIANGFSELNDPIEQSKRFSNQLSVSDDEKMKYDEDFIKAMEYGMPPTAGAGIGIDRLIMLLTDKSSIRDVLLFPHTKPKS
jgi:lysyl-tRNA synthetase class 2